MRARIGFAFVVGVLFVVGLLTKEAAAQSRVQGLASGTVGIVQVQTIRLTVTNTGLSAVNARAALISNPTPTVLVDVAITLGPGESRDIDLPAITVPREHFDSSGRAQIRASVRSTAATVLANLEVFDNETGKTNAVVSLVPIA